MLCLEVGILVQDPYWTETKTPFLLFFWIWIILYNYVEWHIKIYFYVKWLVNVGKQGVRSMCLLCLWNAWRFHTNWMMLKLCSKQIFWRQMSLPICVENKKMLVNMLSDMEKKHTTNIHSSTTDVITGPLWLHCCKIGIGMSKSTNKIKSKYKIYSDFD